MEQHRDSRAAAPAPSAASPEADLNPAPEPAPTEAPPPHGAPAAPPPPTLATDGAPPPSGYDPSEYRWVPVRRRPRYDGWTEEKQRRFIEVLADTGLVGVAAKSVGMTRETAYRLRRSAHGAAFARAWDAARQHAAGLVEDVAFERALEGVEQNIYDDAGEVVCTKRVYNDRLLMWLLSHLKPERYGAAAAGPPAQSLPPAPAIEGCQAVDARHPAANDPPPPPAVEASLTAMEPRLPAPPEQLLDPDALALELQVADIADGKLPRFLSEQRPPKSDARLAAEARAAREARGAAAFAKDKDGGKLSDEEFADLCYYLDPTSRGERSRKRYR